MPHLVPGPAPWSSTSAGEMRSRARRSAAWRVDHPSSRRRSRSRARRGLRRAQARLGAGRRAVQDCDRRLRQRRDRSLRRPW